MPKDQPYRNRIELLQGTLDMMILRTLQWGAQHGHGIGLAIRNSSQEALQVEHGSLYPALHRLEKQGWIAADWKVTENKQRAKYYRLTAAGKRQLLSEESRWNRMVEAIQRVMRPSES
jgi:PadR family transcriptional regulator PadR